jgi:pimeloyl-ACP methyl ester carboxylesterase
MLKSPLLRRRRAVTVVVMATFESRGLTLAYDDIAPMGAPIGVVLLVHGFATNRAENWRRLGWLSALERKGYRAVALDLPGHGESDKPHDPAAYGRDHITGDIVALIDHLGLGPVDLLGYSMGAHLSLAVALGAPSRVNALILGGVGGRMLTSHARSTTAMTMAEALTTADVSAITDPILKGFRQFAENQGEDRLALAACSRGDGGLPDPAALRELRIPTLVIAGSRDELAGDPQALANAIPGAKAVTLPACDHFSAIPHALFKAAVFDFLEGWEEVDGF